MIRRATMTTPSGRHPALNAHRPGGPRGQLVGGHTGTADLGAPVPVFPEMAGLLVVAMGGARYQEMKRDTAHLALPSDTVLSQNMLFYNMFRLFC